MSETTPNAAADDAPPILYYRHSGRAPLALLLPCLAIGIVMTIPLAFVYSGGDIYIPFVKLRAIWTGLFGAAIPFASIIVLRWAKVRNEARYLLSVLIVTTAGYYFAWCAWIWILAWRADEHLALTFALHPSFVWRLIQAINVDGTFGISGSENLSGISLWVVWFIEAATIFVLALGIGSINKSRHPFCESCNVWCPKPKKLGIGEPRDAAELKTNLEAGQFKSIGALQTKAPPQGKWMEYLHHSCPKCGQLNTLTVKLFTATKTKNGKVNKVEKTIVNKLLLHPGEAEQIASPPPGIADHPK